MWEEAWGVGLLVGTATETHQLLFFFLSVCHPPPSKKKSTTIRAPDHSSSYRIIFLFCSTHKFTLMVNTGVVGGTKYYYTPGGGEGGQKSNCFPINVTKLKVKKKKMMTSQPF